jgi:hypothetical protein
LNHYNNEDLGIILIKHYPFKKYKVGSAPLTENRNNNLEEVIRIRDCKVLPKTRAELARDLYMFSFYLCGMNAVDLFKISTDDIRNGRVDYNRSKTKGKRKDRAFISIKIIDEAKPLYKIVIGRQGTVERKHKGYDMFYYRVGTPIFDIANRYPKFSASCYVYSFISCTIYRNHFKLG